MPTELGLPWRRKQVGARGAPKKAIILAVAFAALAMSLHGAPALDFRGKANPIVLREANNNPRGTLHLIVRESSQASPDAERLVGGLGGSVTHELPMVGGFSAELPGGALPRLLRSTAVAQVWGDGPIRMSSLDLGGLLGGTDSTPANTVWKQAIRLPGAYTGAGVTVAMLDTGVTRVADLGNRVLARVDFTRTTTATTATATGRTWRA